MKKGFGDRINWKMFLSDYMNKRGGVAFTMRSGEEVMLKSPFQDQVIEEVTKEVLGNLRSGKSDEKVF